MGRVQDQSNNQAEYELHPQEYQYDPTQDPTLPLEDDQYQEESSYSQDPSDAAAGIEPQPQQQFQQPLHYGSQQAQPAAAAGIEPQYQQQFQQPPQYRAQQEQPAASYISQRNQQVSRPQTPQMNAMKANQLAPTVPYQMQRPRPLPLHMQQSPQVHVFPQCSSQPPGPGLGTGPNGYPAPFPAAYKYEPPAGAVNAEYWTSGLFDCMNDPTNALITAFFPCVTFGQLAEIVDHGHTTCGTSGLLYGMMTLFVVPCILSCTYRTKLRNAFGLYESPAPDWVVHCLCECCALCQEYRELQARGLDPSIGWMGNQIKGENIQMQQGAMVPPRGQTMMV